MKRVLGYVRVSTQEQAKEGYSIDEQIERLTAFCKAKGWTIVKIYTDAGFSGGSTERPALHELINAVRTGHGDTVLVYKLDRLSRSQKDTLELIEDVFLKGNVDFISISENFDTSTPFGRAMIGILAVFAQLEREQIKERTTLGREGRAKDGFFHGGGKIPIGYRYVDGRLIIDDYEAMQVRECFELFLRGLSIRQIEKCFLEKGYTHSGAQWSAVTIKNILRNELYVGKVKFNGKAYDGTHDPIINSDDFTNVARLMEQRGQTYKSRGRRLTHSLLAGLIYCARCGARYGTKRHSPNYLYYCCYSRTKQQRSMIVDPDCKNKNWRMDALDDLVLGEIRKLALDPGYIDEIGKKDDTSKRKTIEREIEKTDAQRSRLIDVYALGGCNIDELKAKIAPLNEKKERLTRDLTAMKIAPVSGTEAKKIAASLGDVIDRGVPEEIRLLIETLIERIEIDGDDITIFWRFCGK